MSEHTSVGGTKSNLPRTAPPPKRLEPARYRRACEFMLQSARPLDRAMFRYRFETGSTEDVVDALMRFQQGDGGFGDAIEPDIRFPGSSVIATTVGLQTLRALGTDSGHPILRNAMKYLVDRYDPELAGWRPLPLDANHHPHAPWWIPSDSPDVVSPESWGNPNAEILGYLFEHSDCVPASLLSEVSDTALRMLERARAPIPTYSILCYLRCTAFAPGVWRRAVLDRLRADAALAFDPDPANWGMDIQPFWLVPSPCADHAESELASVLAESVRVSLDREIERQSADGSWRPRWSWGSSDEAWKIAERDWAGEQTLRTLEALHHHGRIGEPEEG